jgi:UDP-glucose 4-epimerase
MRLLLTGASSFTGAWFARTLAMEGYEVVAALRGPDQRDATMRGRRLAFIRDCCRIVPEAPFGSEHFLELLRREPFDLLCHHGAEVGDYKCPDYDVEAAVRANCHDLEPVLEAFLAAGGRALVLTGSIFEADEGQGEAPLRAFNPYGLAKTLTWHRFRFAAERRGLAMGKLVVAAPFGPWEKDGFSASLMRAWVKGEVAVVRRPGVVRDHVAIAFLARAYARLARLTLAEPGTRRASPSGIALPLQDFAQLLSERMEPRLGRACRLIVADPPEASDEPLVRRNHEPMPELHDPAASVAMWDDYARYWLEAGQEPSSRLSIIS